MPQTQIDAQGLSRLQKIGIDQWLDEPMPARKLLDEMYGPPSETPKWLKFITRLFGANK